MTSKLLLVAAQAALQSDSEISFFEQDGNITIHEIARIITKPES
jgi:hypothetical protein